MPRRRLLTTNAEFSKKNSIDFQQSIIVCYKSGGCRRGTTSPLLLRGVSFVWTMRYCDFINNKLLKQNSLIKLGSLASIILNLSVDGLKLIKFQKQYAFKSFSYLFFLLILFQLIFPSVLAVANKDAARLFEDLLADYNKLVRPVENNTATLIVKFKLKLSQLLDVVDSFTYFFKFNLKTFLAWKESNYDN